MVRYKKRYFVIEYERSNNIGKHERLDLEPLNSKDVDIADAMKDKIYEFHGDFGRATTTIGFKYLTHAVWCIMLII